MRSSTEVYGGSFNGTVYVWNSKVRESSFSFAYGRFRSLIIVFFFLVPLLLDIVRFLRAEK
jgi:hypothetical protein